MRRAAGCCLLGSSLWLAALSAGCSRSDLATDPARLVKDPETFGDEFQGAYLYRNDGAALLDVYSKRRTATASVVRRKMSVRKNQVESVRAILDAKRPLDPDRDIRVQRGSVGSIDIPNSPNDLFKPWLWIGTQDLRELGYIFQGWEEIDGRPCVRIQLDWLPGGKRHDLNFQRFWIDMDHNGQVVRHEAFLDGKRLMRKEIELAPRPLPNGGTYWLPVRCRIQNYRLGEAYYSEPLYEKTIALVRGSVQLNTNLPDALFSIRRSSGLPLPGELEKIQRATDPHGLRRQFESQPAAAPYRIDPVSIRKRIDDRLAEAKEQATLLEASSAAREVWPWSTVLQYGFALLGVVLLGGASIWFWRHR
jgi:hypothetical protein